MIIINLDLKGQAKMLFNKKDFDSKQRFSIRKLSVGVCSVLLSTLFLTFNEGQTVHASTETNASDTVTAAAETANNDTSKNSGTTNTTEKNDAQNVASSLATPEKHAPIPVTEKINKTESNQAQTVIESDKTEEKTVQENQNKSQINNNDEATSNAQVSQSTDTATVKDSSVQKAASNKSASASSDETSVTAFKSENNNTDTVSSDAKVATPVMPHADGNEDITPMPWTVNDSTAVVVGTNLANKAGSLLQNEAELEKAGAKFSWVGNVPTVTEGDYNNGSIITGTVRVTYANGTYKDVSVSFMATGQVQLNPSAFYYVNKRGDSVNFDTPDSNGNSYSTLMNTNNTYGGPFAYQVIGNVDTSTMGIHWADIQVTDNSSFNGGANKVISDPYIVKVPYVVEGLKLRDDIPVDKSGNPVINAQLATMQKSTPQTITSPAVAFDPTNNSALLGQYFYQDYALAYALGIKTSAIDWTNPTDLVNTKTNSFKLSFSNLPNSKPQEVTVNYVAVPQAEEIYFYNWEKGSYQNSSNQNKTIITDLFKAGYLKDKVWVTLADGTKVYATNLEFVDNPGHWNIGSPIKGQYNINFDATFDETNSAGQPVIFSDSNIKNAASEEFTKDVNKWYQTTNNSAVADFSALSGATWQKSSTKGIALAPTVKKNTNSITGKTEPAITDTVDISNGTKIFSSDDLSELVKNPTTIAEAKSVQSNWLPSSKPNPILDDNNEWPEGTTFEWIGDDGATTLTFDKAGEMKTGRVKVTLPSGSSRIVKDIGVTSKAEVKVASKTVDYGTILKAEDLVTNTDVFPEGTTFQFVNNSEPKWSISGSYNNVQITATYTANTKDDDGKDITETITTPVASCAVAINDTRRITVLEGSSVPDINTVLNFDKDWEEHSATWSSTINTNSTNQGEITVHYPASNLDQKIRVFVTVIPKTTAIDGESFFTNGNKYDGTPGSIANGTENQGSILTQAGNNPITYETYNEGGVQGEPSTYTQEKTSYSPSFSLSGLKTNSDGSLASGVQNVTVRVSVPKGTIGAQVDTAGNYYYDLATTVNIAQSVTFEFVDTYNNDKVIGQTYSQEFIPGKTANLNFKMEMPNDPAGYGYELATGASIPTQYTLAAFTQTPVVVQVPIHQKMHFSIKVHDEDSNTDLGTVDISGSTAGNGGYDPGFASKLTFPKGANATDYYSVSTFDVPTGVTLAGDNWGSLTNPATIWYIPNYKWDKTVAVESALIGSTMTINVKHKTQNVTDTDPEAQQTRTVTVNYLVANDGTVNGKEYKKGDKIAESAVLDVYYSRSAIKDLVTGKVTYGDAWLWNTKKGDSSTPGYHVVSGKWTLPQEWASVVADIPTEQGFTYDTKGDGTSDAPANQFVFPTYTGDKTSVAGKNSVAYTSDAPVYEAKPVHDIWYMPIQTETRTITENYVYADAGDLTGQKVFDSDQIEVFYQKTGTRDPKTGTVTYGNWSWDTSAGDADTPGFHIISGQGRWNDIGSKDKPTTAAWGITPPSKDGYTAVTAAHPVAIYSSTVFGNPLQNSTSAFTNDTDPTWYWRNSLTTYYVPSSNLTKTVVRTINITEPGKETATTTQTAKITRTAHLDANDSGIEYNDWGTNSLDWYAKSVPKVDGYTMSVTKTVNGVTTPIEIKNNQIPAETVSGTTQDTIINVTWGAVATAALTGNGESTYNGQAITNDDLNKALKLTVTGPTATAGNYVLQAGDVEFSTDGTNWTTAMPVNADEYQVRLTQQGENNIIAKYGNNSIVWTQDGKSTITNSATYTIKKLDSAATMANAQAGNYEITYNGIAPSSIDPSKFVFTTTVNGQPVTLNADDLTSDDFAWSDGNAPVNVGTYQVVLNNSGLAKLNKANLNFNLTNTGNGTFIINQANASATLSGSASRPYNGQAVSVDDVNNDGTITLTLHYPQGGNADYSTTVKLSDGDFTWDTPNGQAPVNASNQPYTITLNQDAIEKIIKQNVGTGQNGVSNVKFNSDAISGSANFTITPLASDATLANTEAGNYSKVYDAQPTNEIDPDKFKITTNVNGQTVSLNMTGVTGGSYEWVNATGNPLSTSPQNAGTYYVKLTDDAFKTLQANNPNFTLSNKGLGIYTITQANATGELTGSNSKVYNAQAITLNELNSNGQIKVTLNFPGVTGQTYTLKNGDYTISGNATDAGEYTVTLTSTGVNNVEDYIKSIAGVGQNKQSNVKFASNAINGTASFEIIPSANVVSVSGTQTEIYNGSPINVVYNADGTNSVKVSIAQASGNSTGAVADLTGVNLDSGDFEIVKGPAQNAGSYEIKLTAAGLDKIQKTIGNNYSVSLADTTGTLVIDKYKASAIFSGNPQYTYTGKAVDPKDYLDQFSIKLNEPNNPTYKLVAGDIEFKVGSQWTTQAPINVGQYEVRLSKQGWINIKAINSENITWSATESAGVGTYTINVANATATLSGKNSMVYTGTAVTTADLYANNSAIAVTISGDNIVNLPTTFILKDGDYTWMTSDGNAPVDVGNYTIKLTQAGIDNIQSQINQAVGAGNVVLSTTADGAGMASFEITQAVASNVQLRGNEKSIYSGQAVNFDPTNSETAKNFGFNNVENLIVPTFTTSDFSWYDSQGNEISAPVNAGTYYLRLNNQGKNKFAAANKNYTFVDKNGNSTITGQIEYVVDPAQLVITITGTASKVFNDEDAVITQKQINEGDIKIVWNNSDDEPTDLGKFSLTPEDLEVIDSEGNPVKHANAGYNDDGTIIKGEPYRVRLTSAAIEKIEQLSGASNYAVSQSDNSGKYFIYEHKAELTLTGNQTTVYGTALPFDESKYTLDFSNWLSSDPKPHLTWENGKLYNNGKDTGVTYTAGDLYVDGYPDGSVPTNVGSYMVKISKNLTDALRKLFPDYDFAGNIGTSGIAKDADGGIIEPVHTPADYVITPAVTTITISGAQHVKYGESTAIIDGQYTASVTAPVSGKETDVVTDVALNSADLTTVPSDASVGGYTIKLTAAGLKKIQDAITGHGDVRQNYNWTQADNASANFFVDQMPVTIAVTGDQSVVYGSSEWLKAIKANPSGYTLTVTTENGTKLSYTAKDGDLVFNQTPGNVGEYQVELSAQGLNNIEKELGTNYAYPQIAADVTAKGTLTVNQGAVTITLNGSDGKTYDAKQTLPSGLDLKKYGLTYSATVYSADGTAQTLDLTADDLQIVGNATNVGTYQVELSSAGQEKLKQLTGNNGANYKWTFDTKADYKITAAMGKAELSGSNEKTFNGSAVTTAEINSNGQILVHFTFPGSTTQSTYVLQNGDYTWNTEDGKAPANVGNYTISLNKDSILSYLQAAINNQAGSGNIVITADNLSGQASFKITPKAITNVTVSGNTQSKIYNGQAADLDVSGLTISANDTVANTPLVNPGIKASDFTWYDANGAKLDSIPTDVGTYQARLNTSVLAELQKANPNYQFDSVDGVIDYEITPATATASINGSVSRDYNAQTTSVSAVMNNIQWTSTGLISGQDLNLTGLTANSVSVL